MDMELKVHRQLPINYSGIERNHAISSVDWILFLYAYVIAVFGLVVVIIRKQVRVLVDESEY